MGELQVKIKMVDDRGEIRLHAYLTEPTRIDVVREPVYVFARLAQLAERALAELHTQALALDEAAQRG